MQIKLDMDSGDEEDLDKYLTSIHTNKNTGLVGAVGTNPTNFQSGFLLKRQVLLLQVTLNLV